jgi:hypothetical protein
MASHWSFGHLQLKLWANEGPGVKLEVWLPTTKRQESTSSRHPNQECNMALESSRREIQLWFRPRLDQTWRSGDMSSQTPGTPIGRVSGQFRDSNLGVPGKRALWMWLPRSNAENTIWGKVVASPESRPWWVLCVKVPMASPNTQGFPECELTLLWLVFGCRFKLDNLVPLPSLIPGFLARPSTRF